MPSPGSLLILRIPCSKRTRISRNRSSSSLLSPHPLTPLQVQSLRKIFHDKTLRFNQLQRELTSLRLSLQPQSKHQANRSASLFHVSHEGEENTDEFLSKFDEFQKTSSRHSRRNQGGGIFDDHSELPTASSAAGVHRNFRKSEPVDVLESNLFCVPSEDFDEEDASSPELNSRLKEEVPSLTVPPHRLFLSDLVALLTVLFCAVLSPFAGGVPHTEHLREGSPDRLSGG
jgi:hypothetical protein